MHARWRTQGGDGGGRGDASGGRAGEGHGDWGGRGDASGGRQGDGDGGRGCAAGAGKGGGAAGNKVLVAFTESFAPAEDGSTIAVNIVVRFSALCKRAYLDAALPNKIPPMQIMSTDRAFLRTGATACTPSLPPTASTSNDVLVAGLPHARRPVSLSSTSSRSLPSGTSAATSPFPEGD